MITSRVFRGTILSSVVALLGFGLAGCADMVGDSLQSRQEGNRLYNAGQYSEAAGAFHNAIRTDPRDYQAHYGLAVSYDAMKQYQQAVAQYKTTLDVMTRTLAGQEDPAFRAKTIDTLGACVARSDSRDAETAALAQQAQRTQKGEDWFILAKAYGYGGDADSAIDAYQRALLQSPKSFYINKEFGLYLLTIGQSPRAIAPLQKAYAMDPKDEKVAAGLRQAGVVPGLSLKDEKDLAKPLVPKGPLPQPKWGNNASNTAARPGDPAPAPAAPQPRTGVENVQAPRD